MLNSFRLPLPSSHLTQLASFMALAFGTAFAIALFNPVLSSFLANRLNMPPWAVGLFYTVNALSAIVISQYLARYSDRQGRRKPLILCCLLMGAANALLFFWCRSYWVLLFIGIPLLSTASSANPQLFALARDYKDQSGQRSVMFTSIMRTQQSLAWVIGPAIAFGVVSGFGYKALFLLGLATYLFSIVLGSIMLPNITSNPKSATTQPLVMANNKDIAWLFTSSTLMWACNIMYIISMPLYIVRELHLPQSLAGWLMGTAAALEIPTMLLAGYLTRYWRMRSLLIFASLCGWLFYLGLLGATSAHQLLFLQLANAAFIGILGGLGMVYFQDLLPGRSGHATTLFMNSVFTGSVVAGSLAGLVAQYWDYGSVFVVNAVLVLVASAFMLRVKPL